MDKLTPEKATEIALSAVDKVSFFVNGKYYEGIGKIKERIREEIKEEFNKWKK